MLVIIAEKQWYVTNFGSLYCFKIRMYEVSLIWDKLKCISNFGMEENRYYKFDFLLDN